MTKKFGNLFSLEKYSYNEFLEYFETIFQNEKVKIEKIVSQGHRNPDNFWYDQDEYEWVILLQGSAKIKFSNNEIITLNPGDYILIEPHEKHRVEWTDPTCKTFWLAIFFK